MNIIKLYKSSFKTVILKMLLFVLIFLANSCISAQLKAIGTSANFSWKQSREYLEKNDNGLEFIICQEKSDRNDLILYLKITNTNYEPALIDPLKFYCSIISDSLTGNDNRSYNTVFATKPEEEIKYLDDEINHKEINHEDDFQLCCSTVMTVFETAACIYSIITIFTGNNRDQEEYLVTSDEEVNSVENEQTYHEDTINTMQNKPSYAVNNALPDTILFKDQTVEGIVIFPHAKTAGKLKICFPTNISELCFDYQQLWGKY